MSVLFVCFSKDGMYFPYALFSILFQDEWTQFKRRQEAFEKSWSGLFINTFIFRRRPINLFVVPVSCWAVKWFVNKEAADSWRETQPVLDLFRMKRSEKGTDLLWTDFWKDRQTETDTVPRWPTASWELSEEIERKPPESCRPVTPISLTDS